MQEDLGVRCPECGSSRHQVLDTRQRGNAIRRRRRCKNCKQTFYTMEYSDDAAPWSDWQEDLVRQQNCYTLEQALKTAMQCLPNIKEPEV